MLDAGIPLNFIQRLRSILNNTRRTLLCLQFQLLLYTRFTSKFHCCNIILFVLHHQSSYLSYALSSYSTTYSSYSTICIWRLNPHDSLEEKRSQTCCSICSWLRVWLKRANTYLLSVFRFSFHKLNLNADKSEVYPFLTWSNYRAWQPAVSIGNHKVRLTMLHVYLAAFWTEALHSISIWRN